MDFFKNRYSNLCDNEKCWLKQNAIRRWLLKEEINNLYAPTHPVSWKKNKNEWLSNFDIEKVMKQYEDTYPDFLLLVQHRLILILENLMENVWDELCNFKLENYLKKQKKNRYYF